MSWGPDPWAKGGGKYGKYGPPPDAWGWKGDGYGPGRAKGGPASWSSWGPYGKGDPHGDPWGKPASKGSSGSKGAARSPQDAEKEKLVQSVKSVQRTGQDGRDFWERYCAALRTGNNDPSKHSMDSLRHFLEGFEKGESPEDRAVKACRTTKVLRLRGVPFQSKITDIVEFMEGYSVRETDVALGYTAEGRRTGEAYVLFAQSSLADSALDALQKKEIKGRYIELFRSSEEEYHQVAAQAAGGAGGSGGGLLSELPKEELVQRVKWVQRTDSEGKEQWYQYCDATRTGNRDPSKHSSESMRIFLEAYERGEPPELPAEKATTECRVLRLRGVPFQGSILDVVSFLADYGVGENDVCMGYTQEGRRTGEAFAAFHDAGVASRALDEMQKKEIGGRYIELFRSNEEEMRENMQLHLPGATDGEAVEKEKLVNRVKGIQRSSQDGRERWESYCDKLRTGNRDPFRHSVESIKNFLEAYERGEEPQALTAGQDGTDGRVVRLRGVPFQSNVEDVVEFLEDLEVDRTQVSLGFGPDGRKTGQAFVIFSTAELADKALEAKQKQEINGRYIELFRSSYEELKHGTQGGLGLSAEGADGFDAPAEGAAAAGDSIKEQLVANVKFIQRSSSAGKEYWEAYCDALRMGTRDPQRHSVESIRNFLRAHERGESPEDAVNAVAGDGRVIRLRGVPFQSDVMDVVEFVKEYRVDKSMVTLGRTPEGKATGEAFVVFPTKDAADRALGEKQKQEIKGRYIELFRSTYEDRDQNTTLSVEGWSQKDELVARVKGVQRSDQQGKEMWYKYCDDARTGNRDPSRHSAESLQNFLEAYERGETPQAAITGDGRVLRLRGVPFQCGAPEVVEFLQGYGVDEVQVALGRGADGRPTGDAFVVLPSLEVAERALEERQKKEIRGRYIEIFRSSYDEWTQAMTVAEAVPPARQGGAEGPHGGKGYDPWGADKGKGKDWGKGWGPPGWGGPGWDAGYYGPMGGYDKGGKPGPYDKGCGKGGYGAGYDAGFDKGGKKGYDKGGYGKDAYGKDAYGKDAYGKDAYGKDAYGKGAYGKDGCGKDAYGKGTYGKDGCGKDAYGKGPYGKDGCGKDGYGKDAYGKDAYGKDAYGKDAYGKDAYGKDAYGKGGGWEPWDGYSKGKAEGKGWDDWGGKGKGWDGWGGGGGWGWEEAKGPGKGAKGMGPGSWS